MLVTTKVLKLSIILFFRNNYLLFLLQDLQDRGKGEGVVWLGGGGILKLSILFVRTNYLLFLLQDLLYRGKGEGVCVCVGGGGG